VPAPHRLAPGCRPSRGAGHAGAPELSAQRGARSTCCSRSDAGASEGTGSASSTMSSAVSAFMNASTAARPARPRRSATSSARAAAPASTSAGTTCAGGGVSRRRPPPCACARGRREAPAGAAAAPVPGRTGRRRAPRAPSRRQHLGRHLVRWRRRPQQLPAAPGHEHRASHEIPRLLTELGRVQVPLIKRTRRSGRRIVRCYKRRRCGHSPAPHLMQNRLLLAAKPDPGRQGRCRLGLKQAPGSGATWGQHSTHSHSYVDAKPCPQNAHLPWTDPVAKAV